jgi:hypothetical protein
LTAFPKTGTAKEDRAELQKWLYPLDEAGIYVGRATDATREIIWTNKTRHARDSRRILLDIKGADEWTERNKTPYVP